MAQLGSRTHPATSPRAPGFSVQWLLVLLVLLLLSSNVSGQDEPGANAGAAVPTEQLSPAKRFPLAIPLADIVSGVETFDREVAVLQASWLRRETDAEAVNKLRRDIGVIDAKVEDRARIDLDSLDQRQLNVLLMDWQLLADRLAIWRDRIDARSAELEAGLARLEELTEIWGQTLALAEFEQAPETLIGQARGVTERVNDAHQRLQKIREPLSQYRQQVYEHALQVAEMIDELQSHQADFRRKLLTVDGPPIWDVAKHPSHAEKQFELSRLALDTTERFGRAQYPTVILHLVTIALCIAGAVWWRNRLRALELQADAALARLRLWLSKPISVGVFLGAFIGGFYYQTLPMLVFSVWILLVMSLAIRLVILGEPRRILIQGGVLMVVFLLETAQTQVLSPTPTSRLLLLLENVLALWVAIDALPWLREQLRGGPVKQFARLVATMLPFVLFIALCGNIFGAMSLSSLLLRGTVNSIVAGVVLMVAIVLVEGIVTQLLRQHQSSLMHVLRTRITSTERIFRFAVRLWGGWIWLDYTLGTFAIKEPVVAATSQWLTTPWTLGSISVAPGQILGFVAVIVVSLVLSRLIRLFLEEDVLSRVTLPRGVAGAISVTTRYLLVATGFLVAMSVAGVELTQVGIMIGALGVGIGLGLQSVVANFVSGLILVFERPLQAGDTVQVGATMGNIVDIGVRASRVRTFQGAEVIVPNSELVSKEVTNWTLSDRRKRLDIPFITDLDAKPRRVTELMIEVANAHPQTIKENPPNALFEGTEEGFFKFTLSVWVELDDARVIRSELGIAIHERFEEEGIRMPDLSIRSLDGGPTTGPS